MCFTIFKCFLLHVFTPLFCYYSRYSWTFSCKKCLKVRFWLHKNIHFQKVFFKRIPLTASLNKHLNVQPLNPFKSVLSCPGRWSSPLPKPDISIGGRRSGAARGSRDRGAPTYYYNTLESSLETLQHKRNHNLHSKERRQGKRLGSHCF